MATEGSRSTRPAEILLQDRQDQEKYQTPFLAAKYLFPTCNQTWNLLIILHLGKNFKKWKMATIIFCNNFKIDHKLILEKAFIEK